MEVPDEQSTWQAWFRRHGPRLVLWARQWTRSVADAEDVVQEAFVRYWRHQRQLGGDPMGLLLTSIRRAACDLGRREDRRAAREQTGGDPEAATGGSWFEPWAEGDDRRAAMEAALQRLPDAQRQVLVLKIWGERTFEQIGGELGVSPHTAASRYRYALGALRRELTGADCHG